MRLGETEVVVRAHVESLGGGASKLKRSIVVGRLAVEQVDEAAGNAGDGASKAVVDANLEAANVKVVKVVIQWCIALELS